MVPTLLLSTLVSASLFASAVQAVQTITITTRICSTSPRPTTTVQSTATVVPVPWSDYTVNQGTPFVVAIVLPGYSNRRRAEKYWLLPNGNTTTNPKLAGQYRIVDGELVNGDGHYVTTDAGVNSMVFVARPQKGALSRRFASIDGSITWEHSSFATGKAQFFKSPIGIAENAQVVVKFSGPDSPDWSDIKFEPVPVASTGQATSSFAGYNPQTSTFAGDGYGLPPASSDDPVPSSYVGPASQTSGATPTFTGASYVPPPPSSSRPPESSQSQDTTAPPESTPQSTTSSAPASATSLTPDGTCGPVSGHSCVGYGRDNCCSVHGYCGDGPDFCGAGCQSAYGLCDEQPSSKSADFPVPSPTSTPPAYSVTFTSSRPFSIITSTAPLTERSTEVVSTTTSSSKVLPASVTASSTEIIIPTTKSSVELTSTIVPTTKILPDTSSLPIYTQPATSADVTPSTNVVAPTTSVSVPAPSTCGYVNTPAACPVDNIVVVMDANGVEYRLGCSFDANPGSYTSVDAKDSFNDCFLACDASDGCAGFTYFGVSNGDGPGACYLKKGDIELIPGHPNVVSAYKVDPGTGQAECAGVPPTTSTPAPYTSAVPETTSSSQVQEPSSSIIVEVTSSTSSTGPSATPPSGDQDSCPYLDGTVYSDTNDQQYSIHCSSDCSGGGLDVRATDGNGLQDCLAACSANGACGAVVYSGDDSQKTGNCYLKTESGTVTKASNSKVQCAVKLDYSPQPPYQTTTTRTPSTPTTSEPAGYTESSSTDETGPIPYPTEPPEYQSPDDKRCTMDGYTVNDDVDDSFCEIDLPFDVQLFGQTSRKVFAGSNGYLTLDTGSTEYDPFPVPDTRLPPVTIEPFFDDLYIYAKRRSDADSTDPLGTHGVLGGVYVDVGTSFLNVTWVLSRVGTFEIYVFSALYDLTVPGEVRFVYAQTGGRGSGAAAGGGTGDDSHNDGATAAIGLQGGKSDGTYDAVQWSYLSFGAVNVGFEITCETESVMLRCEGSDGTVVTGETGITPE